MKRFSSVVLLLIVFGFLSHAEATLIDRGGGLIYDSVLNVTWLQDANYARTSGNSEDGLMTWTQASTWAYNLQYYDSSRNVTWTDWRLPGALPINGISYNTTCSDIGSTDVCYNISAIGSAYPLSTRNEMAYMYYNNLGGLGFRDLEGHYDANFGLYPDKYGPFINLQTEGRSHWSANEWGPNLDGAFTFNFYDGYQGFVDKRGTSYAWAVRDGDVAPVPLPGTIWLLGSGLAGIMGYIKLKRNRGA